MKEWHCPSCRYSTTSTDDKVAVYHHCTGPPRPSIQPLLDHETERQRWARSVLGEALADAVTSRDGDDALLRRDG